ncbi:MAG: hypothetical protein N4A54_06270 [Peptostreptococcaceae bacterium]|jgi:hypothetical protein|nr:hypothetical protein [Peptostreptococcaceae bacterium]
MDMNFLIIMASSLLLMSFFVHINNKKNSEKMFDPKTSNNVIADTTIDVTDENDLSEIKIKKSKLINFNPDVLVEKLEDNDESNVTQDEFNALHHMSINELKAK